MNVPINRIETIKNMGVFSNYKWNDEIANKECQFGKINIFYGQNYSGKTTLSRIFRALERGRISNKYGTPQFSLKVSKGNITQKNLTTHGKSIRVFNEDFIKENLRFFLDEEQGIKPFAILGESNTKSENEIKALRRELGSNQAGKETELYLKQQQEEEKLLEKEELLENEKREHESKLTDKAREIKNSLLFNSINYDKTKLVNDFETIKNKELKALSPEEYEGFIKTCKEETKKEISLPPSVKPKYAQLSQDTEKLLNEKITATELIEELDIDVLLSRWVEEGIKLHKEKRDTCGFCGGKLSGELWEKLGKHFNESSKELKQKINSLITEIDAELKQDFISITIPDFYNKFEERLTKLSKRAKEATERYKESLTSLKEQLKKRHESIFKSIEFDKPKDYADELMKLRAEYEKIIEKSNSHTNSLESEREKAQEVLRLEKVRQIKTDISYEITEEKIKALEKTVNEIKEKKEGIEKDIRTKEEKIKDIKSQMQDELKGAKRINELIKDNFGHDSLSMEVVKENSEEENAKAYHFQITRNGEKAFHLSEGECRLISFCYFMAKLEDINTEGGKPIIWIDDPISSLDGNHIFFIYSLIKREIVDKERYSQLFISTHNMNFLKYLYRLREKKTTFFLIQRKSKEESTIKKMPKYMTKHVTEFVYLFKQIYECSKLTSMPDDNAYPVYNFGNNARKFLELYLYYKYPDKGRCDETMKAVFGAQEACIERCINENSHADGTLERSSDPPDFAEIKKVAQYICAGIEKKDLEQYEALKGAT